MATGTREDLVIYHEEFYGGMWEGLTQVVTAFNGASLGCINLVQNETKGDYEKTSFWKDISGLIAHRDPTDTTDADAVKLSQDEYVEVKVPRIIGPVENTRESFKRLGKDPQEMSFVLGQIIAGHKAADMINTTIKALVAAIKGLSTAGNYDATGQSTKTLTHPHLVSGMAKLGDAAPGLKLWVMHSKPFFDLMQQSLTDKIFEVAGVTIWEGNVASFGKPILVLDSPGLWDLNGSATDTYNVLGLVSGAAVAKESESQDIVAQTVTGKKNLITRVQGEYAFTLGIKGMAWDIASGQENPDDTALALSTNWDFQHSSVKQGPGIAVKVQ